MIVLGVDPGSVVTGYGLIEKKGDKMTCIHSSAINLPRDLPFFQRIHDIYQTMVDVMTRFSPREMAIEDMFFAKNVKSALKIGHARGAVLIAATQCGLKIFEYSPLEIKKAVVGYGRATKEQVRSMVQVILKLNYQPDLDTADALAAAICHLNWTRFGHPSR
ncbi:MAG: crossover junction endodeoxyribonuclease RuvC [Deltaproteobacteria bacterium]|nr:crossover junction endodeoxyribonuclease RuvC [Deltaproteobacteria bacterium]